jgi:cytochrome P450
VSRDETTYPDAETFRPERWLDPAYPTYREPLTKYPDLKGQSAFGYGNRSCLGQGFSEIVLFTMTVTLLSRCDITRKKDLITGKDFDIPWMDIPPPHAIIRPAWFPLDIKARGELLSASEK